MKLDIRLVFIKNRVRCSLLLIKLIPLSVCLCWYCRQVLQAETPDIRAIARQVMPIVISIAGKSCLIGDVKGAWNG